MRLAPRSIQGLVAALAIAAAGCAAGNEAGPDDGAGDTGATTTTAAGGAGGASTSTSTSTATSSGGAGGATATGACGDGHLDPGEQCDGDAMGKASCASLDQGFAGGTLGCTAKCSFDTSKCTVGHKCGDGVLDEALGEACDGADLGGKDCAAVGFTAGTLACDKACALDTSLCTTCGDGVVQGAEACDGQNLGKATCESLGHDGGKLGCAVDCSAYDEGGCADCGNGVAEGAEDCDGADLAGATCASLKLGFDGGVLGCTGACAFDTSKCTSQPLCGNGKLDGGEACDGPLLGGATCAALGYAGGALSCTAGCMLDASKCLTCGNGAIDAGEECDGAALGGATCGSLGFVGGSLACSAACHYDTKACSSCGNGVIDAGEACDGANLGGKTCQSLGHTGGSLSCAADCLSVSQSACTDCGNGKLEAGEQCDDGNKTPGDGCSATCQTEACDPTGTYTLDQPIFYQCCTAFGPPAVDVNMSTIQLFAKGATIDGAPKSPGPLAGAATTCPQGSFSNQIVKAGSCTETYKLEGSFVDAKTWKGTYTMTFTGSQCSCFGATPCVNQTFQVTAKR